MFENCVIQFEKEKEKNINKYLNLCYKKQGFRVFSWFSGCFKDCNTFFRNRVDLFFNFQKRKNQMIKIRVFFGILLRK